MRVLHTSDWHLGRSLGDHRLLEDQAAFCDWLVGFVAGEKIDLVAVSGDLFDRSIPPGDAWTLLCDVFSRLRSAGATVAAIAGNHDSAGRLAALDDLLNGAGVYLRGGYARAGSVTELDLGGHPLALVTTPFLDPHMAPSEVAEPLREASALSHEGVLALAMHGARSAMPDGIPSMVLSHAFVTGAARSDSERELAVGAAAMVSAEVFSGFDDVALGHLHQPQSVAGEERIRYSGSPLPYSFSETGPKSVCIAELDEAGLVGVTSVEVPVGRSVVTVRGTLEDLAESAGDARNFVRAELTDELRPVDAARLLRSSFPWLAEVEWVGGRRDGIQGLSVSEVAVRTPGELVDDFWRDVRGERPGEEVRAMLHGALHGTDTGEFAAA